MNNFWFSGYKSFARHTLVILRPARSSEAQSRSITCRFYSKLQFDPGDLTLKDNTQGPRKEKENEFGHYVMHSLDKYSRNMAKLNYKSTDDWNQKSWNNTIVQDFCVSSVKILENKMPLKDTKYIALCGELPLVIPKLTSFELVDCLSVLHVRPANTDPVSVHFRAIKIALDLECMKRIEEWSTDMTLFVADYWCLQNLLKFINYPAKLIAHLLSENIFHELKSNHVIQILYIMSVRRKSDAGDMNKLESALLKFSEELTTDELAVAALGFFKTQNKIFTPELFKLMFNKLLQEGGNINHISLTSLSKVLRYSATDVHINVFKTFLKQSSSLIPALSVPSAIHVALLGTPYNLYNESLLSSLSRKVLYELETARLKDIAKYLFITSNLNYYKDKAAEQSSLYQQIVRELQNPRRQEEFYQYPTNLFSCLSSLSCVGIYPSSLINQAFDPSFIKQLEGCEPHEIAREAFAVDCGIEIEHPHYKGNRLSDYYKKIALKQSPLLDPFKRHTFITEIFKKVVQELVKICGHSKWVRTLHILPHYQLPEVLVCFNYRHENILVEYSTNEGNIIPPPHISGYCCAFVIASRESYSQNTHYPLGKCTTKMRQLERLGYDVIEVPWMDIHRSSPEGRQDYLKEKIRSVIIKHGGVVPRHLLNSNRAHIKPVKENLKQSISLNAKDFFKTSKT